jgi:hypothetical protein
VRVAPAVTGRHAGTYALPTGGKIRVDARESSSGWSGVTLTPEGRDAFQVLAGGAARDMAENERRLMAALEKSRAGDYGPIAEVFGAPPAEVARMHKETWSNLEGEHGPFQGFDLVGTTSGPGGPTTWVEARFAKGKAVMVLSWMGPVVGNVQMRDALPGGVLYLPESESSFASYDPRNGAVGRVTFADGTLVLSTAAGELRAKKEPQG